MIEELKLAKQDPWLFFETNTIKDLAIRFHPDRYPDPKILQKLNELHEISKTPPKIICGKTVLEHRAVGELRNVYRCREGTIKVPITKSKDAERLIQRELSIARLIKENSHYGKFIPELTTGEGYVGTSYSEELYSFSELSTKQIDGVHIAWIFKRALDILGYIHNKGYAHCAITPEHLLIGPTSHIVVLAGLIHSKKLGEKIDVVPINYKSRYISKVSTTRQDLKMLADLMPANAPKRMKTFAKGMAMSDDAWSCYEEFDDLLKDIYGQPKFHKFELEN